MTDSSQRSDFDKQDTFHRSDIVCDEFEKQWLAGEKPRIEDFLGGITGTERAELLLLELECRCRLEGSLPK